MKIKGRGKFTGTLAATEGGITVRVDDERNDEFWLEVDISLQELLDASIDMLNMTCRNHFTWGTRPEQN